MWHLAIAVDATKHRLTRAFVLLEHEIVAALEREFLQVREKPKGKPAFWRPAKNWTLPEFISKLETAVECTHKLADAQGLEGDWYFAFDNPSNHHVTREDIKNLRPGDQLVHPARYSPELMQPVEHSHGYTCKTFLQERLQQGMTHWDIQAEWELLREVFMRVNTPEVVSKTVARVKPAADQIIKAKGGRIPKEYR